MDIVDFALHVDKYLNKIIQSYGIGVYFFLFMIVFLETGLVLTPFFPGDSLLFISGTFAANGMLNIFVLFAVFSAAAILGDSLNYWIGAYCGEKVFAKNRLFKKEYLEKAKTFYEKHGGKAIVLARFAPILRTFAPFVAGIGKMNYRKFIAYNITGGLLWVSLFLCGGYFFGGIPVIKENLMLVTYVIIAVSLIPAAIELYRHRKK
ncbi:MAG: DedA family protein [Candidatus Aenigmarchaeota archaeon]|nr:DedA family protein [Candidatus Aenigmarchaeota archaeon]